MAAPVIRATDGRARGQLATDYLTEDRAHDKAERDDENEPRTCKLANSIFRFAKAARKALKYYAENSRRRFRRENMKVAGLLGFFGKPGSIAL